MTDHRPVPGRLRAPAPGWTTRADVVVVGSGIAGLTAALGPGDSPEQHERDTLVAGAGACDVDAVRILVTEGPEAV
ncbi:MAG: aspartate oxidase, partial [Actinotalea sp.]|nr:aspartate oxidase [Actinotalea sp.]